MSAKLRILDGSPVWLSDAIVPSKDTVVSPMSPPHAATVQVTSTGVFVYVKVENTGTVDLGACGCPIGAWVAPTFFANFIGNATTSQSQVVGGVTFAANPVGDSLTGPGINVNFGASGSGRRAWDWSPDGRFFAYAASATGPEWGLTIVALQNVTRADGTTASKGSKVGSASGVFAGTNAANWWNNGAFGWAGSSAVIASGHSATVSLIGITWACPLAPAPNSAGTAVVDFAGQVDWKYLVSPCGESIGFAPRMLNAAATPQNFFLVSTATATIIPFRKNNIPTSVGSSGANVSIATISHTANGIQINTGNGTIAAVDDPDCTMVGGGVTVRVDRVLASTLPTANLGVLAIGTAALGACSVGSSTWVQVPNMNGWANQGQSHWCLLAQAYTVNPLVLARPWNGQATNPPAFPIVNDACAQRNIEIN